MAVTAYLVLDGEVLSETRGGARCLRDAQLGADFGTRLYGCPSSPVDAYAYPCFFLVHQ